MNILKFVIALVLIYNIAIFKVENLYGQIEFSENIQQDLVSEHNGELTLEFFIEEALKRNPKIQGFEHSLESKKARILQAGAILLKKPKIKIRYLFN